MGIAALLFVPGSSRLAPLAQFSGRQDKGGRSPHRKRGYITTEERPCLNEVYDYNPLLFDFILKRAWKLPGSKRRLPASVFMRKRRARRWMTRSELARGYRTLEISPITLEGQHVRLEPLSEAHEGALVAAARDGELWNTNVTIIPNRDNMAAYIDAALRGQAQGKELPFVIIRKASGEVVGTTRFYDIVANDRRVAIGYTWLAKSAQRTAVNTESKLLLLTHAFEQWNCIRVELLTDVLNEQSRAAILRLGARQEGILRRQMILPNGRIRDSVVFSIIDEEWPEVKARLAAKLVESNP